MTPEIAHTTNVGHRTTAEAAGLRKQGSGGSAFEFLLGMQLAVSMPEMAPGTRFTEYAKAQYQRGDERTLGESAQEKLRNGEPGRARTKGPQPTPNARGVSGSNGQPIATGTASSGNKPEAVGAQGTWAQASSDVSGRGASTTATTLDETGAAKGGNENAGSRHLNGGAFGAMLAPRARASVPSTQANTTVSAVKSGGGGAVQVGLSSLRSGGRTAGTVRGRPSAPPNRARTFHLEQQKMLAQVRGGIAAALKREGGVVTLRLRPESLGEMKIKIELSEGKVNAIFRADNDSARQLLESSLDALKSSLEAKGLRVDRLFVESPDDPGHKQNGSQREPNDREQMPGGDREATDDGDRPRQTPGMARNGAGTGPQADAEALVGQNAVSDARIAEDSTQQSGLEPGEDEMLVRVRLDAVA